LGQNLHSVHHLYPRVPFYRYRTVFDAMAPEMMAKGTEVWRWQRGERAATSS
ncbi:MAG: fatty acid desaturase, partial [Myxococcales bacterium]|nr:fatty acid desaturase [Myxococcales bacterium]